jgi:deoxyinosine 3'endonuclease (endonuclease V)
MGASSFSSACPCVPEDGQQQAPTSRTPLPMPPHDPAIEAQWRVEQSALQRRMVAEDAHSDWRLSSDSEQGGDAASPAPGLRFVGGCDISFIKGNEVDALAMVVVLSFPELEVVHEVSAMVKLTAPYIPGFLAFREAPHLVALLERIKAEKPELFPQVLFVDGNGMLHPKGFGLACHLGVLADLPTVGVGKTMMAVDGLYEVWKKKRIAAGSHERLVGTSGRVWGAAVAATSSSNPTFISVGHRVSLDSAVRLTQLVTRTRIPEPVRAADLRSRDLLR